MSSSPIVYLIRHGEKPPKRPDGDDEIGLSTLGLNRSQALVQVFGKESKYNISLIMAQQPKKNGRRSRPYDTIKPLAQYLGSDIELEIDIDRDDIEGIVNRIRKYPGPGNILLCWEHKMLEEIATALGAADVEPYPGARYDVIWTIEAPYSKITSITSEHCPGLDDARSARSNLDTIYNEVLDDFDDGSAFAEYLWYKALNSWFCPLAEIGGAAIAKLLISESFLDTTGPQDMANLWSDQGKGVKAQMYRPLTARELEKHASVQALL